MEKFLQDFELTYVEARESEEEAQWIRANEGVYFLCVVLSFRPFIFPPFF